MLTRKAERRTSRAVIVDGVPVVKEDDSLRIGKLILDFRNKYAMIFLTAGHDDGGAWSDSGDDVQVVFDAANGRENPLHNNVWGYFMERIAARGDLSLNLIERIIRKRELLPDEIDDPPPNGEA